MRIVSGAFRGRTLKAPKGDSTRPTTDRVREAMMSVVASARGGFEDAVVLDAFAGSGALGLEALSRGAATAYFFEKDSKAFRTLCDNVSTLGLSPKQARTLRADVLKEPPTYAGVPFDLLFFDPPYMMEAETIVSLCQLLDDAGVLASDVVIVYEHSAKASQSVEAALTDTQFVRTQYKKYGDTALSIIRKDLT